MHLDKLIELLDKNVLRYNNPIERAVLEHLRRLKYLESRENKSSNEMKKSNNLGDVL